MAKQTDQKNVMNLKNFFSTIKYYTYLKKSEKLFLKC